MEEEFCCAICLEIAEDAVETSCCHHIFCEACIDPVTQSGWACPQCRSPFNTTISHMGRRIIGNMKTKCKHPNCGQEITRSNVKDHERTCKHRSFSCSAPNCNFKGTRPAYASHLFTAHEEQIIANSAKIFDTNEGLVQGMANASISPPHPNTYNNYDQPDRINKTRNLAGRDARLGRSGKYYCGGSLGVRCRCCNGHCGPTTGCNCKPCMTLDIQLRKLPRGWYVNDAGASCRVGWETGRMYCGRKVMVANRACDGWCGPTNGPNCDSCKTMQQFIETRYAGIWVP